MIRSTRASVAPENVGVTLPHEHILHTIGSIAVSSDASKDQEILFEDLIDYRRTPFAHGGRNLMLQKEDEAFRELEKLQQFQHDEAQVLIVDVTLPIEGRGVLMKERLRLVERLKGVHFVIVTTFEIERISDDICITQPINEASECISKTLEAELMFGIEKDGVVVFPGAMYQQIHVQREVLSAQEQVLVQGLALVWTLVMISISMLYGGILLLIVLAVCVYLQAQARTHAPLYLSFSLASEEPLGDMSKLQQVVRAWIRALLEAGAEKKKLVVCHVDRWCHGRFEDAGYAFLLELFDLGVSVLFNMIGLRSVSEVALVNPCLTSVSNSLLPPSEKEWQEPAPDSRLIEWLARLLKDAPQYLYQVLLSTNVCQRTQYRRYGGGGYAYLFEHFKHRMLHKGVTAVQWHQIVRTNAVDLLAWYVPPEAPPIPKNYLQCSICGSFFEPVEGEYFTKFAFTYCGTKCLRRHSRQQFASPPTKT
uniref:Vms1-associating treble clef domain-containing protein n=1 Tax=Hyaloperonospora arabidopsidis (strain Emoy2) TaxID=559515 RepID=M4BHP8_HYAAE